MHKAKDVVVVVAPEVVVGVEVDKTVAAAVSEVEANKSNKLVARVVDVVDDDDEAAEEAPIDYNKPHHLSQRNPPHSEDPSSPFLLLHSHDHKFHTIPGS